MGKFVKSYDYFGTSVISFNFKGSTKVNKSYFGTFLSLVLFALTLTYTARRYTIMVNYEDSTYFTKEVPSDKTKDNPLYLAEAG